MKSVEIIGYNRANLGKTGSKAVRAEGLVPCVLYGGAEQVHFMVPTILFREIVYTPNAHKVILNIEGVLHTAILQETQFHPVNDTLIHADFLELNENKAVKMNIPVVVTGTAVGVTKGGKLNQKLRHVKVLSLPANLPDFVTVDVSALDLGKTIKVSAIAADGFRILNTPSVPVVSVDIPRALKGKQAQG